MTGVPGPFTPGVVCMTTDAMPSGSLMAEAGTAETPRRGGSGHVAPLTWEPVALTVWILRRSGSQSPARNGRLSCVLGPGRLACSFAQTVRRPL